MQIVDVLVFVSVQHAVRHTGAMNYFNKKIIIYSTLYRSWKKSAVYAQQIETVFFCLFPRTVYKVRLLN